MIKVYPCLSRDPERTLTIHTQCMRAANALASLHNRTGSPKPSLLDGVRKKIDDRHSLRTFCSRKGTVMNSLRKSSEPLGSVFWPVIFSNFKVCHSRQFFISGMYVIFVLIQAEFSMDSIVENRSSTRPNPNQSA